MGLLKQIDLFKSVHPDHKQGSLLGSLLTIFCILFIFLFFYREMRVYKTQKLSTKLYVSDSTDELIKVYLDISFFKVSCDQLEYSLEKAKDESLTKILFGEEGCRVYGYFYCKRTGVEVNFTTDIQTAFMDLISNQFENQGIKVVNRNKMIDFSHKINLFQIGVKVSKLTSL